MTGLRFVRLILKHLRLIAGSTLVLFLLVFMVTAQEEKVYSSHTLLNTGLISGYNIESQQAGRVDYAFTNNEIENLIQIASATETLVDLALNLMIKSALESPAERQEIGPDHKDFLLDLENYTAYILNPSLSYEQKMDRLREEFNTDRSSYVYELLHSKHPYYSLFQLEKIEVSREGNSDMLRMEYSTNNPFVCQLTLATLTELFLSKHKKIKEGQTNSVIDYFESATDKTSARLNKAENDLLKFRVKNQIINYYEQTRFISGNKQELEKKYQEKLKTLAGADSVIRAIEGQLKNHSELPMLREQMSSDRSQVSSMAAEIALLELMDGANSEELLERKMQIQQDLDSIRGEMATAADAIVNLNLSKNGVQTKELIMKWLNSYILREESKAQLEVMRIRQEEYVTIYKRFAPLGSTLKRLEREIDVAEREYLENLHSYNQAQLHKFNMTMSSNLKVIDPPFFPASPQKSKRVLLLMLSLVVGISISVSAIIGFDLMNDAVKSPARAKEIIGLPVAASLPVILPPAAKSTVQYDKITYQSVNLFFQHIRSLQQLEKMPITVAFISTEDAEGKTYFLNKVEEYSTRMGIKSLIIRPEEEDKDQVRDHTVFYESDNLNVFRKRQIKDFLSDKGEIEELTTYDYVFLELPSIIRHAYHPELLNEIDQSIRLIENRMVSHLVLVFLFRPND